MANTNDASIKLVYAADKGTNFTVDMLELVDDYDVVADVEIGEDLNQVVDEHTLRAAVVNLTTATQVAFKDLTEVLKPQNNTQRRAQLRLQFGPIQNSNPGDVLQVVASYKVVAGVMIKQSTAFSETFTVGG